MKTASVRIGSHTVATGLVLSVVSLSGLLASAPARAAASDTQFHTYIFNICNAVPPPPTTNANALIAMCTQVFTGNGAGGPTPVAAVSANLGTINASTGTSARKKKGVRVPLDEPQDKAVQGASADGGKWGLLLTPQYSRSNRPDTDLENGYQASLSGLSLGLDYRYSDSLVLGLALGNTRDRANFNGNAGFLHTGNTTATLYGTWLYSERVALDGYMGYGKLSLDNQRQFSFGTINGTMSGTTSGQQFMAGMSASYQQELGPYTVTPSLNLDYIKTTFQAYNESGSNANTNAMALHYSQRRTNSLTSSLGGRLATSYGYDWGSLQPSARLAAVHEFQNRTRQLSNELVLTPGTGFLVATDAPDRNYLIVGLGAAAALNGGTQWFFDFEKRSQDRLLNTWAVSLGGLFEF